MKISVEFRKSKILIGYCQSENNPADLMTKVFRDPCSIINSSFYRHGDGNLKTIKDLEKDTVAKVKGGEFTFLGIPERFLVGKQERYRHRVEEECPLVQIVQTRRSEKEKESQDMEEKKETKKGPKLSNLQMWNIRVKRKFMLGPGQSLVDQNYTYQLKMVLSRT